MFFLTCGSAISQTASWQASTAAACLMRVATSAQQLLCYSRTVDELEKVRNELKKYLHPLLDFSVRNNDGKIELVWPEAVKTADFAPKQGW